MSDDLVPNASADDRVCPSCGESLQPEQDWCLHCGSGIRSRRGGPGWRSAAAAVGGAAVLALGAAAAAYAALEQSPPASPSPAETVAQTPPPPVTSTSTSTTSTETIPPPPTRTEEPALPPTSSKPPGIPTVTPIPEGGGQESTGGGEGLRAGAEEGGGNHEGPGGSKGGKEHGGKHEAGEEEAACTTSAGAEEAAGAQTELSEAEQLEAKELEEEGACPGGESGKGAKNAPIVLRAQAASTYDPNAFPEADFVGPQLAIDGVTTTAWTATATPELAPKVHAGLLIDLGKKRQIVQVGLISATLGMTVQVYGTLQRDAPKSIEAAGWKKLSRVHLVEERNSSIALKRTPQIRQLLIWVVKAPEVQAEAEGEEVADTAAVNELALYEPK